MRKSHIFLMIVAWFGLAAYIVLNGASEETGEDQATGLNQKIQAQDADESKSSKPKWSKSKSCLQLGNKNRHQNRVIKPTLNESRIRTNRKAPSQNGR